jgi:hypothetical protein
MSVIYDIKKVKQIKLVTGEELICEIIEEDDADIIVRNAISINFGELVDGSRAWSFRYYMCYQDDPERFILLKLDKVVAVANPMQVLIDQYEAALNEMIGMESGNLDNPEYLGDDYINGEEQLDGDSDSSNVLSFPTLH